MLVWQPSYVFAQFEIIGLQKCAQRHYFYLAHALAWLILKVAYNAFFLFTHSFYLNKYLCLNPTG